MIRVGHIITNTGTGGAESMLAKLVRGMNTEHFQNDILSLLPVDNVGRDLRSDGFSVESSNMRPGQPSPAAFTRLVKWIRVRRPLIVQTWMYHSDLLGGVAGRYFAKAPVIWNIRQSNLDSSVNTSSTLRAAGVCSRLSRRVPSAIVCGSEAARRTHSEFGYFTGNMEVIPNGFDTDFFRRDPEAKHKVRSELHIPHEALIVGLAARFDLQKDHNNFIQAARILIDRISRYSSGSAAKQVYFVLCGKNIEWTNPKLREIIGEGPEGSFGSRLRLLGRRHDLAYLYSAFDISGISSIGEGFPNVVGEAMSCGTPCVVTDVGDSAQLVGDTGVVVPPAAPEQLASAWERLILMTEKQRIELGMRSRARIKNYYSISAVAQRYEQLYAQIYRQFYGVEK